MKIKGLDQNKMVEIEDLNNGDTFILDDELYIVIDIDENEVFDLCDNRKYWLEFGCQIKQVNCEIKVVNEKE